MKIKIKKIYILLFVLILDVLIIFFAYNILAKKKDKNEHKPYEEINYMEINGNKYRQKSNIKTYLFIGEDETGEKKQKQK